MGINGVTGGAGDFSDKESCDTSGRDCDESVGGSEEAADGTAPDDEER